jgi:stage V sporulation protein AA
MDHYTPKLYVRLRKRVKIPKDKPIILGHIAQVMIDPEYERAIKEMVIYRPHEIDGNLVLIDMMMIVEKVKTLYPQLSIEHFGEPHSLLEIGDKSRPPHPVLIVAVWLLLFIGSGLAIMNFHADVSMPEVHQKIYKLLTGRDVEHPLMLQIPYSLGIGLGMVIFFNHLFKKKFNEEPSPLEVEMYGYQEKLDQYIVKEEYRKMNKRSDSE